MFGIFSDVFSEVFLFFRSEFDQLHPLNCGKPDKFVEIPL
jgi:hypothetical protein